MTRLELYPSIIVQQMYDSALVAFLFLARARCGFSLGDLCDLVATGVRDNPPRGRGESEGALIANLVECK